VSDKLSQKYFFIK